MLALLTLSIEVSFHSPAFAQNSSSPTSNQKAAATGNHITLNPAGTSNLERQPPILTNISNKGIYKVQLTWSTPLSIQSLPKNGFAFQILFMNGSGPSATKTIPQIESNIKSTTTLGVGNQYSVPGSIKRLVPVSSFDVTIYGNHGKVLWNKVNQPVTAGRGYEQVVFPNGYTGDITILIHNIKSNNVMTGSNLTPLSTPLPKGTTDSVEFLAKVG